MSSVKSNSQYLERTAEFELLENVEILILKSTGECVPLHIRLQPKFSIKLIPVNKTYRG